MRGKRRTKRKEAITYNTFERISIKQKMDQFECKQKTRTPSHKFLPIKFYEDN